MDEHVGPSPAIMHTHEFALRFPEQFPDRQRAFTFLVVGDGQSAAEVAQYLHGCYPNSRIYLVISNFALRPADSTPFVNEVFCAKEVDWFYGLRKESRSRILHDIKNTNYGVVDGDLIASLYRSSYQDQVTGTQRLFVLRFSRLVSAAQNGASVEVVMQDLCADGSLRLHCDAVVLATGYSRRLDKTIFEDLLPFLCRDESGDLIVSRRYRVQTKADASGGLYLQGLNESSHGIGDTLLSLLPFRSQEILDDIAERSHDRTDGVPRRSQVTIPPVTKDEYPPRRHLEEDEEKIYAVVERFPFATLVSADAGQPFVTHVPLTLDRSRGSKGVLFGHMDKFNPHVGLLNDRSILAIFHGPNSYISPYDYETDQLPTWNSITVHAYGRVCKLRNQKDLVRGLVGISEYADRKPDAFRLSADDPRIPHLIEFIVGFEIEIERLIGRFKLSQDRAPRDQELAKQALIRRTEEGERVLIETVLPDKRSNATPAMVAVGQQ
jgi:predicted FMN-binding regulatory protein PaiB